MEWGKTDLEELEFSLWITLIFLVFVDFNYFAYSDLSVFHSKILPIPLLFPFSDLPGAVLVTSAIIYEHMGG